MKQITGRQLAKEIERVCRGDLDTIEQKRGAVVLGIAREAVIFIAIMAAERRWDYFSPEIKEAFRNRSWMAAQVSKRIANLCECNEVRAFVGVPEYLKPQAEWLSGYSKNLGKFLREHGRNDHNHAIPLLVSAILTYRPRFDCWKELARVIRVAYIASGRVAHADNINVGTLHRALLRAAKLYRTPKTGEQPQCQQQ